MKIDSSSIQMSSEHQLIKESSVKESFLFWRGDQRPDFEGRAQPLATEPSSSQVAISEAARDAVAKASASGADNGGAAQSADQAQSVEDVTDAIRNDPKMRFLIQVIEALTGRKVVLMDAAELEASASDVDSALKDAAASQQESAPRAGWGLEYDRFERVYESEQTSFSAQGVVKTSDGKTLQFDLSMQMKREYLSESSVSIRAGDGVRKDPLVINFDGTAAELGNRTIDFDLDADGQSENVRFVGSASGFLALDRNNNGKIDDGTELFGALSGNGFADLAAYDDDGNGWIDENDAIFAQLRIWSMDAAGDQKLETLAQRNVGALYLGNTATPFDLKDSNNTLHGQIRSSGVYLSENGTVGSLQQIDIVV